MIVTTMKNKFEILSFAGSICSIAALTITMSQNFAILNMLKIVIGVTAFVGMGGLIYYGAEMFRVVYLDFDNWAFKLMYWLVVMLIGIAVSGGVAFLVVCVVEFFIMAGTHIIGMINESHL